MRAIIAILPALVLVAAGCGPKTLALPTDPVDRAAACGVVAAASARTSAQVGALPLEAQGRILHYALLAGAEGKAFDQDRAAAVATRMPELEGDITGEDWQPLVPACASAYPATAADRAVTLPAGATDARLACFALADFLTTALQRQGAEYGDQLRNYTSLKLRLDESIGAGLRQSGRASTEAGRTANSEALSTAAKLGAPIAVMTQCLARFG